jgi:hypothetical protein
MVKGIGVAALLSSFAVLASAAGMDSEDIVFRGRGAASALSSGESDPINLPFDAVGLNGVLPDVPARLEVSRWTRDGSWSEWVPMEQHAFEGGRFWAKAVFPFAAPGKVRIRVQEDGAPKHTLRFYGFEAFRRGEEAPGGGVEAEAEPAATRVVTRAEWGAKSPRATEPTSPYRITIHHTQGAYAAGVEEGMREARAIQDYHMNGRGWNDIGYQYLMDGLGNLYQGRGEKVLGAHTADNNAGNIGVSLMGNYMELKPNDAQMESLKSFLPVLAERYGIPAERLYGHRDLSASDCPGDKLFARLPELRKALGGREEGLVARLAASPAFQEALDGYAAACAAGGAFDGR